MTKMLELKKIFGQNNLFLISDNHFGHQRMFEKFEPSRQDVSGDFSSFEEEMRSRWNKTVQPDDVVLYLGDFCINKRNNKKTIFNIETNTRKLNGRKILIKGNHDQSPNELYYKSGWDIVSNRTDLDLAGCIVADICGERVLFSHFGIFISNRFNNKYKKQVDLFGDLYHDHACTINIHGHSHGNAGATHRSYNVSVEKIKFTPIDIKEIINTLH